jgi:hypothetical protein
MAERNERKHVCYALATGVKENRCGMAWQRSGEENGKIEISGGRRHQRRGAISVAALSKAARQMYVA